MPSDTLRMVTGTLRTPTGDPFANKTLIWFKNTRKSTPHGSTTVVDEPFAVTTDVNGHVSFEAYAGNYVVRAALSDQESYFTATIQDTDNAQNISDLFTFDPISADVFVQVQSSLTRARAWSENQEGVEVDPAAHPGEFSAKHHAGAAAARAQEASDARDVAVQTLSDAAATFNEAVQLSASYGGYRVNTFAELASLSPERLPIGNFITVTEIGKTFQRVADGQAGAYLDYSATGGMTFNDVSADKSAAIVNGVLELEISDRSYIYADVTEPIRRIRVKNWPASTKEVILRLNQPEGGGNRVRMPLEWFFKGGSAPQISTAAGTATTVRLTSENGGGSVTYEVVETMPVHAGSAVFEQIGQSSFHSGVSEIRVPIGTERIYVPFDLDRPCICTTNAWVEISDNSTVDTTGIELPDGNYYVWRPRDDLRHYVTVDISALTPAEGEYLIVGLDATSYQIPTATVTIVFDNSAPQHLRPDPWPYHRASKRIFLKENGGVPVYRMNPNTVQWSDSGYDADGNPVWRSRLAGGGYTNNGNAEAGLYMSEEIWPNDAITPHSIATDGVGQHVLLNSVKLASPVPHNGRNYGYQATVLQGQTLTETHMRTGVWRFVATLPSRKFAWSAIWCIGVRPDGTTAWPPEIDIVESFNDQAMHQTGYMASHNQHNGFFGDWQTGRVSVFGSANDRLAQLGAAASDQYADPVEYILTIDEDANEVTVYMDGVEVYSSLWGAQHEDPDNKDWKFFPIFNIAVANKPPLDAYDDGHGNLRMYEFERYDVDLSMLEATPPPPASLNLRGSYDPHKSVTLGGGGVQLWNNSLPGGEPYQMRNLDTSRQPNLVTDPVRGSDYVALDGTDILNTTAGDALIPPAATAITYTAVLRLRAGDGNLIYFGGAYGISLYVVGADLRFVLNYRSENEDLGRAVGVLPQDELFVLTVRAESNATWSVRVNGVEVATGSMAGAWNPGPTNRSTGIAARPMDLYYMGVRMDYMSDAEAAELEAYAALVARVEDLLA